MAGVPNGHKMTAVAIASVQRSGLREFLETEMSKVGRNKGPDRRGSEPVRARQTEEMLVSIRGDRVVIGTDQAAVNGAFAGDSGFSATPFGQRIGQAFREGTGILLGMDVQSLRSIENRTGADSRSNRASVADSVRYLIAEQRTSGDDTKHRRAQL